MDSTGGICNRVMVDQSANIRINKYLNKAVVLDTNAYRFLGRLYKTAPDKYNEFIYKERISNNKAFFNVTVALELFNHISDTNDPHFEECKYAIKVAQEHCTDTNSSALRVIPNEQVVIADVVGVRVRDELLNGQEVLVKRVFEIFDNINEGKDFELRLLKQVSDAIKGDETSFMKNFQDFYDKFLKECGEENVRSKFPKEKKDIKERLRLSIIVNHINQVKLSNQFVPHDEKHFIENALKKFSLEFPDGVLRQEGLFFLHLNKGGNYSKKDEKEFMNNLWDLNLLYALPAETGIDGRDILLITNDNRLRTSVALSRSKIMAIEIEEYIGFVSQISSYS
ncbi:MAG: hypothetical protein KA501_10710 [Bacteroidia bacterium]|nr:hypothetical protein [Bacteroidia bacterium]